MASIILSLLYSLFFAFILFTPSARIMFSNIIRIMQLIAHAARNTVLPPNKMNVGTIASEACEGEMAGLGLLGSNKVAGVVA